MDKTESLRRALAPFVNELSDEAIDNYGQTYTTEELRATFIVESFLAPFVTVTRKADGVRGTLLFRHEPRIYFQFVESK